MIGIHVRRQVSFMATVLQHPFGTTAFGDFLRSARERRGLTIQQIAHETKIPRRLLESLEHGDLGAIPSGMYQRAEIRAYAKAVGLDQALALSELERALGTRSMSTDRKPTSDSITASRYRRPYLLAAFGVAIFLIGIVAWYGRLTPLPIENRRAGGTETPPSQRAEAGGAKAAPARLKPRLHDRQPLARLTCRRHKRRRSRPSRLRRLEPRRPLRV